MQARILGACAVLTLALAGCGTGPPVADRTSSSARPPASGTASATPKSVTATLGTSTTPPPPPPTYIGARRLTASDTGATIQLSVGESVSVSLPADYDPPAAAGDALTRKATAGGYPTGEPVDATFTAVHAGRVDITSATDYPCLHTTPKCQIAQSLWRVHVIVAQ
jgi:hypothetical protein